MNTEIYCLNCLKNIRDNNSLNEIFMIDDVLCSKCRYMMKYQPKMIDIDGFKIRALYRYEGLTRKLIIQYKEYLDEALATCFLYPFIKQLKEKYSDRYLISIPSSDSSYKKRGFDHVKEIFSLLDSPFLDVLTNDGEKQQKQLSLYQRQEISKHIHLKKSHINMLDKKILIVDDILTTGSSMRAAYELLKDKCKSVEGLVISYNESYLSNFEKLIYRITH